MIRCLENPMALDLTDCGLPDLYMLPLVQYAIISSASDFGIPDDC